MARRMKEDYDEKQDGHHKYCGHGHHGCYGHAGYGLGFVGAAVYFLMQATSFWTGVLAILKAIVWPAFMIFGLLKFLGV